MNEYALADLYNYASNVGPYQDLYLNLVEMRFATKDFGAKFFDLRDQPPSMILDKHTWPSQFGWPFVFWAFAAAGMGFVQAAPVRWFDVVTDVTCNVKPQKRMV